LILFNRGVFWDDWIYFVIDEKTLLDIFGQFGNLLFGYYLRLVSHDVLLGWGISVMRLFVFISYLICSLIFYALLSTVREIDDVSRFVLVLLFAVFPIDGTRPILTQSAYAIGYLLFFFGMWTTAKYMNRKNKTRRIVALTVFFLSFMTGSLLAFYATAILYILYREDVLNRAPRSFGELKLVAKTSLRYSDFLLMPFVFWISRYLFWQPHGLYEGYNAIHLTNLCPQVIVLNLAVSLRHSVGNSRVFVADLFTSEISRPIIPLAIAVFILIYYVVFLVLRKRIVNQDATAGRPAKMLLVGCLLFCLGLFPYIAIGKIPVLFDLTSRYALLLPAGLSFIIFYLIEVMSRVKFPEKICRPPLIKVIVVSLVIALCVGSNIMIYLAYQADYYKQQSLIEKLRSSEAVRDHRTFLVVDHALYMNVFSRTYRFYEYTSMMKYAFGDEIRFACNADQWQLCVQDYIPTYSAYNFRNYVPGEPDYVISIDERKGHVDNVITLMYYEISDPAKFNDAIAGILVVKFDPVHSKSNGSALVYDARFAAVNRSNDSWFWNHII
jgi:hypothetical protein